MKLSASVLFLLCGFSSASVAATFKPIANWQYVPLQAEFYDAAVRAEFSGSSLISRALDERIAKKGSSEEGEARLVIAEACLRQGLRYCAFHFALTTAQDFPGSQPALLALTMLEKLVMAEPFNEAPISKVVNSGTFKDVPEALLPMLSYYVALDDIEKDLIRWVPDSIKTIGDGNFWSLRWKMTTALEVVRRKSADKGLAKIEELVAKIDLVAHPELKRLADTLKWQVARLKFELGDFKAALEIYGTLPADGRQEGRVQLERAWTYFSLGEYAQTLGLLASMRAPSYAASADPEQFLLEMLTLRRLCHFASVSQPAKAFRERFDSAIKLIKKRKPLEESAALARMAFMRAPFVPQVDTVSMIREERVRSKDASIPKALKKELVVIYGRAEADLRADIELAVKMELKKQAERLLDLADQINLVDYLSGLDAYRIQLGFEKRDYNAEMPSDYRMLFWPMTEGEFWHDELGNYRVLVKDQCGDGGSK